MRMNRDTLYSFGVFDLTSPVTITKPDTGDRFQSMMVMNQDEYIPIPVVYKPGKYTLTQDKIGSRYTFVAFRTFADSSDPADIKKANALQDQIKVQQSSVGKFESPQLGPEVPGQTAHRHPGNRHDHERHETVFRQQERHG